MANVDVILQGRYDDVRELLIKLETVQPVLVRAMRQDTIEFEAHTPVTLKVSLVAQPTEQDLLYDRFVRTVTTGYAAGSLNAEKLPPEPVDEDDDDDWLDDNDLASDNGYQPPNDEVQG